MPFYGRRRYYSRYRRRNYSSRPALRSNYRLATTVARREVARNNRKMHPIQYADLLFTGGSVNTTPTMHSLVNLIRDQELDSQAYLQWSRHNVGVGSTSYVLQGKYQVSFIHYQLRFQQDLETIETSNTFRTMMYSYIFTESENNMPILAGLDIDQPPITEYVQSMYFDRIRALRAIATGDVSGTDSAGPGTAILKGSKRLRHNFTFTCNDDGGNPLTESGDIRWEAQSDSTGTGLQLFGFIRVYYRLMQ